MSRLSDFYNRIGTNDSGRTLTNIWDFTINELEEVHDYIQWIFPLKEESRFQPNAPLLTDEDIELIDKEYVRVSFNLMLTFYGIVDNGTFLVKDPNIWLHRSTDWITKGNHNFLRLTRILKSLRLFGMDHEATILILFLGSLYDEYKSTIGEITLDYWKAASILQEKEDDK